MGIEIHGCPLTLSKMIPWVKSNRHLMLGPSRNCVPRPPDSFFDVGRLRLNKTRRPSWVTVHVQKFIGRIAFSHQITELQELISRPDPVRPPALSNQDSSRCEAIENVNHR